MSRSQDGAVVASADIISFGLLKFASPPFNICIAKQARDSPCLRALLAYQVKFNGSLRLS